MQILIKYTHGDSVMQVQDTYRAVYQTFSGTSLGLKPE